MKKIIICIEMFCILLLSSCIGYDEKDYYNMMIRENKIEHLSYNNLKYFYHYTSGFEDRAGLNYYYIEFKEYPFDFISQFDKSLNSFYETKSEEFETKLLNDINEHIGNKYNEIPIEYRVDYTKNYSYSNFPMIYYIDTKVLIIVEYINVR